MGVLPGKECQKRDEQFKLVKSPEFYSSSMADRITRQRDQMSKDIIQPWDGDKMNPEFVKAYPDLAENYFDKEELKKL